MSLYKHVPHPHVARRREAGPVKVADQHNRSSAVARFNARFAVIITRAVGSMWCAYAFALFDIISLPDAIKAGTAAIVSWIAQTFLQLVLLSIIMVGQDVQAKASDVRNEQSFNDVEAILHGQGEQAAHLAAQDEKILAILEQTAANTALTQEVKAAVAAPAKRLATRAERGKEGSGT
jgi:hypothetical protein